MRIPSFHDILVSIGFLAVLAALVLAGKWVWDTYRHPAADVDFNKYSVRGIDVSAHNGEIDFNQVANSGIAFVWMKASEGESVRDARFAENFDNAVSAGLHVGAYHFFRFDCDGVMQAMNLCRALGPVKPDMGIAIDVELENNPTDVPDSEILLNLASMADYLSMRGYPVTFYTNKEGYNRFIASQFADYPLWICSFSNWEPFEQGETPGPDTPWRFWQYSHSGTIPGIDGPVDLNVFSSTRSAL